MGAVFSLRELRVLAHSRTGEILPRIPLSLSIEGPEDLLDLERLVTDGHEIRGVRPGIARLWIESLVPGRNGDNPREAIVLVVHEYKPT